MTAHVVADLRRETDLVDVFVVDNGANYADDDFARVIRPGENLGWLGGCNRGLRAAVDAGPYRAFVLLNNDVRLSTGFVGGLVACADTPGAGLVGPRYDGAWWHQHARHRGEASTWRARRSNRRVKFVDGTCMYIAAAALERVGVLDNENFGQTGWGADLDFAIRVRQAGFDVVVAGASYLQHLEAVSARTVFGDDYGERGRRELSAGLRAKYGDNWRDLAGIEPPVRVRAKGVVRTGLSRGKGVVLGARRAFIRP